jgi:ubiquinone/menaquinone biosynthesis C-methylase UbiE
MEDKGTYYDLMTEEVFFKDITNQLKNSKVIIDVGAGTGWISEKIDIEYGVDVDVAVTKGKYRNKIVINFEKQKLPIKKKDIDGIIMKDIIEHLYSADNILSELSRISKPGAKMYLSTKYPGPNFYDDKTHVKKYTIDKLALTLLDHGFIIEDYWYIGNFPLIGLLSKIFNIHTTPWILKFICQLGFNRNNIIVLARKQV